MIPYQQCGSIMEAVWQSKQTKQTLSAWTIWISCAAPACITPWSGNKILHCKHMLHHCRTTQEESSLYIFYVPNFCCHLLLLPNYYHTANMGLKLTSGVPGQHDGRWTVSPQPSSHWTATRKAGLARLIKYAPVHFTSKADNICPCPLPKLDW